ncbi:hypothetical protein HS088_TW14G00140 [Tripterygium wilfordii]|uniref:Uncharacterized protein n=1 Tax=Tripterygium wilfordii TaxID=458696 RepID=A0A7J7CPS4_TRIWF|nr:hypothetical protein HS088_TW14G00140 [Tripterygium wilfordii]
MFSVKEMPSPSSLFSAYASLTASMMLFRSMINELIPRPVRDYLFSVFCYLFKIRSKDLTLVIEEEDGISNNQLYKAAEIFLGTKINLSNERIKIYKTPKEKGLKLRLEKGEKIVDNFEGIELVWRFICKEVEKNNERRGSSEQQKWFELNFVKKHKAKVLDSYIPFVLEKSNALKEEERVLKMYTLSDSKMYGNVRWDSINLEHPSTFETLAMEPDLKNAVIRDLDRFIKRKKFYKRVGRAWKRGYLLYGPPGTGKSSLVAAMANYLKFDVYDLQLGNVMGDSELRRLLLATGNRSILVIEDIDCSVDFPERQNKQNGDDQKKHNRFHVSISPSLSA